MGWILSVVVEPVVVQHSVVQHSDDEPRAGARGSS